MYKGKFDQKNKKVSAPVPQSARKHSPDPDFDDELDVLLAEAPVEKAAPVKSEAPAKAAPVKKEAPASAVKKPTAVKDAPAAKAPAKKPSAPQPETRKQKKGPRLGGVIFYTLYFMFILVFFLATYLGLKWVHGWLADYEAAQPSYKAEQVFQQLFTDPNWGDLYTAAGAKDSAYEGKEEYVTYMESKVGDSALTYMETSAGLSGKKYVVRLGNEKVATFTLVDKNEVSSSLSLENLENITDIPEWVLGSVEVFFQRQGSYRIEKMDGHTAYVNDVALDDSFTIMEATTIAAEYLPEGLTGVSMCTQEVTGLMEKPTVTVIDEDGAPVEVTYDEASRTFTARTEVNTMAEEQKEAALEAAKINCLWMIEEVKDRGKVAKYYDAGSKPYKDITTLGELWMQGHAGYEFKNEEVSKFASYGSDMFSVYVSLDLDVTRKDGTVKNHDFAKTLFFKNISGSWKVVEWTNVDVSQPVGKVRLTFMNGTEQLTSSLVSNNLKELVTPVIPVPEGKVFSGWVREDIAENGDTTLTVVFQPDPVSGKVVIPEGTTLEPMVLYALFENEGEAVEAPAETPAETTAETAATEGA
nr:hypothetical protein [Oscillospiraceae bacterium]